MKLNKILNTFGATALSLMLATSVPLSAGAWMEGSEDSATTTAAETTVATTEETTTTTTVPSVVLDEEPVDTEETESPDESDEMPEDTEAPETESPDESDVMPENTEAPATAAPETEAATTAAAAVTTPAATYDEVSPFEMYVPDTLNVRNGPGTNYDKLGMAYPNSVVTIIGKSGDWYVIDYYGAPGFLLASNLTEVPETTTTTAAPPVEEPAETEETIATEAVVETDDSDAVLDTEPAETTIKPAPAETTPDETDEDEDKIPAAPVTDKKDEGGLPPIILALICGVATFVLIGVLPVLIHKAHHKKLYQY